MTLTKRGTFWHYEFFFKGQRFTGSTKLVSHRDAKAWEAQFKARLAMGEVGLAPAPLMSSAWKVWFQQSKPGKNRDRAESAWRLHLNPVLGNLRADQVDADVVILVRQRYLGGRNRRKFDKRPRSLAGCNTLMGYLKALLNFLLKRGHIRRLPEIPMPKAQAPVRAYVARGSVHSFLASVDSTGNLHQSLAIRAMLFLGLRESEALGMRFQWFGPGLKTYTPGQTKGKEALVLPVPRELRIWVHAITWGVSQALGTVLPASDGKPHRAQFTRKAIQRGEIHGMSPHRLRTTCATLMAQAGVPVPTIQRQLRHKDIRTTMRYIEVGLADLQEAMETTWSPQKPHKRFSQSSRTRVTIGFNPQRLLVS